MRVVYTNLYYDNYILILIENHTSSNEKKHTIITRYSSILNSAIIRILLLEKRIEYSTIYTYKAVM